MSKVYIKTKEDFENIREEIALHTEDFKRFFAVYAANRFAGFFSNDYLHEQAARITRWTDKCQAAFVDDDQEPYASFVFVQGGVFYVMGLDDFPSIFGIEKK